MKAFVIKNLAKILLYLSEFGLFTCFVHVNTVFSAKEKNCAAGLHCRVPTVAVETYSA